MEEAAEIVPSLFVHVPFLNDFSTFPVPFSHRRMLTGFVFVVAIFAEEVFFTLFLKEID